MQTIKINSVTTNTFARRQTPESEFSHFVGTFEDLETLLMSEEMEYEPGYKDGIILVNIDAVNEFRTPIVPADDVDSESIYAEYSARRDGEDKYLSIKANGGKIIADDVQIVLYSHDVLAADGDASSDADWEIISINATTNGSAPITPQAFARNCLNMEGGTDMDLENKSKEELITLLKSTAKSIIFWNTHIQVKYKN
jgi:hypothetical protein